MADESNNGDETQRLLSIIKAEDDDENAKDEATRTLPAAAHGAAGVTDLSSLAKKVHRESQLKKLGKDVVGVLRDFHEFTDPTRRASIRSQHRRKLNIIFATLLALALLLLFALFGDIFYVTDYRPKHKRAKLEKMIRESAAASRLRTEKCAGTDWKQACDKISSASARRRRRRRQLYTGGSDRSIEIKEESLLLNSDDPSVTYDNFCLLTYRLRVDGDVTFPYHASSSLSLGGNYTMALLIQHGAMRNVQDYFCSFKQLMQEQGYRNFEDILIIAPDFKYEHDDLVHPNDAFWNSSKPWGDWRVGAESDPDCCGNKGRSGPPVTISSFEVLDQILATLTSKKLFPNMNKVSYVGHSAGGQMVQRYAVMSTLATVWSLTEDIDVQFIVANPSSYAYLTPQRYSYNCGNCNCTTGFCTCDKECTTPPYTKLVTPHHGLAGTRFPCYSLSYNHWPYGIGEFRDPSGRYIPYALRDGMLGVERAIRLYDRLHVVYMVGQNDTCNDNLPVCDASCWKRELYTEIEWPCFRHQMDTRCPAMLQGPFRRARGYQYMEYLKTLYGRPTHELYTVPGIGHNASGMFSSEIGMKLLFGP